MKPRDIANRLLLSPKGLTAARIEKAKRLATQEGTTWADVRASMSDHERQLVDTPQPSMHTQEHP